VVAEDLTPAQRRLLEELLAVDAPRPPPEAGLAARLRTSIETAVAPALDLVPSGERLRLNKSALSALSCDGRYIDLVERPFSWEVPMVRGKLAHRAVEVDWRTGRAHEPSELVDRAWSDLALETDLGEFLAGLDAMTAGMLRSDAEQILTEMRDVWPAIPSRWSPRFEQPVAATFADGAIEVRGKTDLTIGRARPDRRQVVVVDLKTGWRRPQQERQDLRLYALLLTLKVGVEPFRLATYYLAEGAWDMEDVSPETLEAAARRVVDGVIRAARLRYARPSDDALRLVAGAYCRWCGRAPGCPAYDPEGVADLLEAP
jgi:hypothetical protein